MSYVCDNCGKGIVVGRSSRHSRGVAGKRWKKRAQKTVKIFRPNLQRFTYFVDGKRTQKKLCTNCLKLFKKRYRLESRILNLGTLL